MLACLSGSQMSGLTELLTIDQFCSIVETQLGLPPHVVSRLPKIGQVEHALAAPNSGSGTQDYYPEVHEKAAAILYGIAQAHALPDANKRSAWLATRTWLKMNGFTLCFGFEDDLMIEEDELDIQATVTAVAARVMEQQQLADWFQERIVKLV